MSDNFEWNEQEFKAFCEELEQDHAVNQTLGELDDGALTPEEEAETLEFVSKILNPTFSGSLDPQIIRDEVLADYPFTDFSKAKAGKIDLRVFYQTEWWLDINAVPHRLDEMTEEYLQNVLTHLFTNMDGFYFGVAQRDISALIVLALQLPATDEAGIERERILREDIAKGVTAQTPGQWLSSVPLVKRINEILDSKEN